MPAHIGVAVSGGADSVFLLHHLHAQGIVAAVLHVNHQLRGAESDRDEAFVRGLASQLGLPVHVLSEPVGAGNVEQEARRVRFVFFLDCIAAGICDAVATGHTLDDQAETVLSRFLRGSGTAGLSGIRPRTTDGIIRPLLGFRRDEIRKSLLDRGISWQEDCSNYKTNYLRNRIRLELMPQLLELNPSLPHVLAATAAWAQDEEAYWNQELDRLEMAHLELKNEAILIELGSFSNLPVAVQRRLLRRGMERVRGSLRGIDFRHVEAIRTLMASSEGSGRIQLPGLDIYRSFDWLRFAIPGFDSRLERNFSAELNIPGRTRIPERLLTIEMELVNGPRVYNKQVDVVDGERCAGPLVLRNWRPGDSYCPVGKTIPSKIKSMFQEQRIPLWERRNWPVIASGDSILWARRFGVASDFAAGPRTARALSIRETEESKPGIQTSLTEESGTEESREFEVS